MISKETVTTPKGILSWPALMEPAYKFQSTTDKEYRCEILFPLDTDFTEVDAAIDKVATRAFGKGWEKEKEYITVGGKTKLNPKYVKLPWRDQSEKVRKDKETKQEKVGEDGLPLLQQGCVAGARWVHLKTDEKFKPQILKLVATGVSVPLTDPVELYAGCIVAASISVFDWEFGGKRGVTFRLLGVCKAGNGKPFMQGTNVEANFAAVEMEDEIVENDDPMKE